MSVNDRMRHLMASAEAEMPVGPTVEWEATMKKARRGRRVTTAIVGFATITVITAGAWAFTAIDGDNRGNLAPAAPPATTLGNPSPAPSATPSQTPVGDCSAAGMDPELKSQEGLPGAVEGIRAQIAATAVTCDYAALAELAREGRKDFSFTFGPDADAAEHWRILEENNNVARLERDVLRTLVTALELPYCVERYPTADGVEEEVYSWPSVNCAERDDADWDALVGVLYTQEEVDQMKEAGLYYGYRIGITAEGDWIYFIAGD